MRRLWTVLAVATIAAALACGCSKNETVTADESVTGNEKSVECAKDTCGDAVTCQGGTCADKPCDAKTDAEVGLDVGQAPPDFTLKNLAGDDVSLSDFQGKIVVLDFWATWCGPCRQEIPMLVSLYEEFRDRGLVVVGVGLDKDGAKALAPFAESNRVSYPVLVGDQALGRTYKVTAIPSTYVIGRDGTIVSKHVGFDPAVASALRADVERLVAQSGQEA